MLARSTWVYNLMIIYIYIYTVNLSQHIYIYILNVYDVCTYCLFSYSLQKSHSSMGKMLTFHHAIQLRGPKNKIQPCDAEALRMMPKFLESAQDGWDSSVDRPLRFWKTGFQTQDRLKCFYFISGAWLSKLQKRTGHMEGKDS